MLHIIYVHQANVDVEDFMYLQQQLQQQQQERLSLVRLSAFGPPWPLIPRDLLLHTYPARHLTKITSYVLYNILHRTHTRNTNTFVTQADEAQMKFTAFSKWVLISPHFCSVCGWAWQRRRCIIARDGPHTHTHTFFPFLIANGDSFLFLLPHE